MPIHAMKALLLALTLAVAGCGTTRTQERVASVREAKEWVEDREAAVAVIAGPSSLRGDELRFELIERFLEREYRFTLTAYETRRVTEPNPMYAVASLGLGCVASAKDCIGKIGDWQSGAEVRSQRVPTGATRLGERPSRGQVQATLRLQGFSSDDRALGSKMEQVAGERRVGVKLKDFAQSLPERPDHLEVSLRLPGQPAASVRVSAADLQGLGLYAEQWLSVEQRQSLYGRQLKERLLAHDWTAANVLFAKLEGLGVALPLSFDYHYGASLVRAGKADQGARYLRGYLTKAGPDAEYGEQAQQLLRN